MSAPRVELTVLGAAREVTGSMLLVETTGGRFLHLEHARDLASTFVGACLHEAGQDLDAYAERLEIAGLLTDSKKQLLLALAG